MCDLYAIQLEYFITHESFLQDYMHVYNDPINLKWWSNNSGKERHQYQPSILKACTVVIYRLVNKFLKQVGFKIHLSINGNVYGGGSSSRSDVTCPKCFKKGHIRRHFR